MEPDGRKQEVVGARKRPNQVHTWWEHLLRYLMVLHTVDKNAGVQAGQPHRLSRIVLLVTLSVSFPYLISSPGHREAHR